MIIGCDFENATQGLVNIWPIFNPMWMQCPPCLQNVDVGHYVVDKDQADIEVEEMLQDLGITKDSLYEVPPTPLPNKETLEALDNLNEEGAIQKYASY